MNSCINKKIIIEIKYINIFKLRVNLNLNSLSPFVGDRFGYTGVTSPFMVLADSVLNGTLKHGDYVILWTVGAGVVASCILLRY
jgi:3-oxoacyl-[acyl-carrier-protein] synthase III